MTQEQRLTAAFQAVGAEIKNIKTSRGTLASLTTTDKTNLVAAINEVNAAISGFAVIDDGAASTDTTKTYSADKISDLIAAAVSGILGGASAAYDTLLEIQNLLGGQDTSLSNLLTAVGNRLRFDAAQTLSAGQKTQACANLGIGEPDTDYVAIFNAALA